MNKITDIFKAIAVILFINLGFVNSVIGMQVGNKPTGKNPCINPYEYHYHYGQVPPPNIHKRTRQENVKGSRDEQPLGPNTPQKIRRVEQTNNLALPNHNPAPQQELQVIYDPRDPPLLPPAEARRRSLERRLQSRRGRQHQMDEETVQQDERVFHTNFLGGVLYGHRRQAVSADDEQRQKIQEIITTLDSVKEKISNDNYENALRTIQLIGVAIAENGEICEKLFKKFERCENYSVYEFYRESLMHPEVLVHPQLFNYPGKLILHPEQTDVLLEERALHYFDALNRAFFFAQEHEILPEFFTHAFFEPGENTICLEGAQQALISWLEIKGKDQKRKESDNIQTQEADENTIIAHLTPLICNMKERELIKNLDGKTYNAYLSANNFDEKSSQIADAAFKEFHEQIIDKTLRSLADTKFYTTFKRVKDVIEQYTLL